MCLRKTLQIALGGFLIFAAMVHGIPTSYFLGYWVGKEIGGANADANLHGVGDTLHAIENTHTTAFGDSVNTYSLQQIFVNDSQVYQILLSSSYPYFQVGDTIYSVVRVIDTDSFLTVSNPPTQKSFPTAFLPVPGTRVFGFKKTPDAIESVSKTAHLTPAIAIVPNPLNTVTTFQLRGVSAAVAKPFSLFIFDLNGHLIRNWRNGRAAVIWNGQDRFGRDVASGTYIARVNLGDRVMSKRIVLIR